MGTYHTISPSKGLMCSFTQNVAARLGLLVDEELKVHALGLGSVVLPLTPATVHTARTRSQPATGHVLSFRTHCCSQRHPSTDRPPFPFHYLSNFSSKFLSTERIGTVETYLHPPIVKVIKRDWDHSDPECRPL